MVFLSRVTRMMFCIDILFAAPKGFLFLLLCISVVPAWASAQSNPEPVGTADTAWAPTSSTYDQPLYSTSLPQQPTYEYSVGDIHAGLEASDLLPLCEGLRRQHQESGDFQVVPPFVMSGEASAAMWRGLGGIIGGGLLGATCGCTYGGKNYVTSVIYAHDPGTYSEGVEMTSEGYCRRKLAQKMSREINLNGAPRNGSHFSSYEIKTGVGGVCTAYWSN